MKNISDIKEFEFFENLSSRQLKKVYLVKCDLGYLTYSNTYLWDNNVEIFPKSFEENHRFMDKTTANDLLSTLNCRTKIFYNNKEIKNLEYSIIEYILIENEDN